MPFSKIYIMGIRYTMGTKFTIHVMKVVVASKNLLLGHFN